MTKRSATSIEKLSTLTDTPHIERLREILDATHSEIFMFAADEPQIASTVYARLAIIADYGYIDDLLISENCDDSDILIDELS